MKIRVEEDTTGFAPRDCRFTAVDDDTYDGAPDSRNRGMVGYGATPEEAIADWHRRLEEWAPFEGDEPLSDAPDFLAEDYAHTAKLLREHMWRDDPALFRALCSNNLSIILAALDIAAAQHETEQ